MSAREGRPSPARPRVDAGAQRPVRAEGEPADPRRGVRLERLLPIACLTAAAVLFASNFMIAFEFTPPGAEALAEQSVRDNYSYSLAVLAVFAAVMLVAAIGSGAKPAAVAVAVAGGIALLLFLLFDLPDAGNVGTLDDERQTFATAEAVPQAGFWAQLIGALGLTITGAALATMTSAQLRDLRPGGSEKQAARGAKGRTAPKGKSG